MRYFAGRKHELHHLPTVFSHSRPRRSNDVAVRPGLLASAAEHCGAQRVEVTEMREDCLKGVHSARYVQFLRTIYADWVSVFGSPPDGIFPNVFPTMRLGDRYPEDPVGRVGLHMHDQLAPIHEHTYDAALEAATIADAAARAVLGGDRAAYALCRPSGHHAGWDCGGGATYLNNAAVAAQTLLSEARRVLLVDIDVHHGNGTQDIFYERDDVHFISLHRDPAHYHPYFWGHADERGTGQGAGFNRNVPLPGNTEDEAYLAAFDTALQEGLLNRPEALVVSLGVDAHVDDPSKGLRLTTEVYRQIGQRFAALNLPTVLVQEGGYNLEVAPHCLSAFLAGFQN
jgi:acetoin utilization deacetylase AcuC-like enzyme